MRANKIRTRATGALLPRRDPRRRGPRNCLGLSSAQAYSPRASRFANCPNDSLNPTRTPVTRHHLQKCSLIGRSQRKRCAGVPPKSLTPVNLRGSEFAAAYRCTGAVTHRSRLKGKSRLARSCRRERYTGPAGAGGIGVPHSGQTPETLPVRL